ncbi:hypothetical protein AUR64_07490 [Haloprofundus marisrubri]|uniref:Uncharacterized protein n=1 Tax=Haloprofundus marisrubri TaxID=1514971 RepID=A0A0W1RD16_9EURY|nr:hypothetical protein AUR64_07490 [Haloprofundus marisrubri]
MSSPQTCSAPSSNASSVSSSSEATTGPPNPGSGEQRRSNGVIGSESTVEAKTPTGSLSSSSATTYRPDSAHPRSTAASHRYRWKTLPWGDCSTTRSHRSRGTLSMVRCISTFIAHLHTRRFVSRVGREATSR